MAVKAWYYPQRFLSSPTSIPSQIYITSALCILLQIVVVKNIISVGRIFETHVYLSGIFGTLKKKITCYIIKAFR